jgi:hypothetical protein
MPGKHQRGNFGAAHDSRDSLDPFQVAVGAETVDAAKSSESVAMSHLDGGHTGVVERLGDGHNLLDGVLMADGVHSIT